MSTSSATPQATPGRNDPFTVGNFQVEIDGFPPLSFSEVSGLEVSVEVVDYRAGDSKTNTDQKLSGQYKVSDVTLKRGIIRDLSLWNWINNATQGNVLRTNVSIRLLDQTDQPVLIWTLRNAWPCKWTGPVLSAGSSDVAIEVLELCHEGLQLTLA